MDKAHKKEIQDAYKQRPVGGGVYRIWNKRTGSSFIRGDVDLDSAANRFAFSRKTGSCVAPSLQSEWKEYGPEAFAFEILETMELEPEESLAAFKRRLKVRQEFYQSVSRE